MNITHINDNDIERIENPKDVIKAIFETQRELHEKYKHIEYKSELGLSFIKDLDFNIDNPKCQYIMKDFAWRVTEEIQESREANTLSHQTHVIEELVDALHFYTEMLIICKAESLQDENFFDNIVNEVLFPTPYEPGIDAVYCLGTACNLLKNKPWKMSHLITDKNRFYMWLYRGYAALIMWILHYVENWGNLYMIYKKKSLVNQFRQETNY